MDAIGGNALDRCQQDGECGCFRHVASYAEIHQTQDSGAMEHAAVDEHSIAVMDQIQHIDI
ncbi:hypothetical protein AR689_16285 [Arthrobacter sp. EpRS71]|nr:hypothetical protein AR689_16285 [Arthrobacter sp. EpRS71]